MKKIYLSLLLLVGLFTLAACSGKKEVNVTYQEANQMLESVNSEEMLEDVFSLKGNFKLDVQNTMKIGEEETTTTVKGSGSVELYIKATTFEEFYVVGKLNLDVESTEDDKTTSNKLNGNLYIIKDTLYLDGTLKSKVTTNGATNESNTTIKMKQSEVVTKEDFDALKESFSTEGSPINPKLTSESEFKLYKVSGGHLLETELSLDELFGFIGFISGGVGDAMEGMKETGENLLTLGITFSDVIHKIELNVKLNLEIDMPSDFISVKGSYHIEGNLSISTKSKAPTMPNMDTLNSYPEGTLDDINPLSP